MTEPASRFDPDSLAQLEPIDLVARNVVAGFLRGHHRSEHFGSSDEFAEHRPYAPGDDTRFIDWRAYARTDRYVVRQYEDETNARAVLVVDASASMAYGSSGLTKLRWATCLAASLGYLFNLQRDAVGLAVVDDDVRDYVPPKATADHLNEIFRRLEELEGRGRTAVGESLERVAEIAPRSSIAIVISDLIDDAAAVLRGLVALRERRSEVIVFHLMDSSELDLPTRQWTVFRDPEEPGVEHRLDARRLAGIYRANLDHHRDVLRSGCAAAHIDYVWATTDAPFVPTLADYLALRRRTR
jgi:uncharacterized protein (DUF58 family)